MISNKCIHLPHGQLENQKNWSWTKQIEFPHQVQEPIPLSSFLAPSQQRGGNLILKADSEQENALDFTY
jgi:hypothetical protein